MKRLWLLLIISFVIVLFVISFPFYAANSSEDLSLWNKFSVSPDGKKLAYPIPLYNKYAEQSTELWISNLDGSGRKKVGILPGQWSAFWYDNNTVAAIQWDSNRIPLFPIGKGKQRSLSFGNGYDWEEPAISPNGKWVAFNGVQKEPRECMIGLLNVQTGKVKRISSEVIKSYVRWSPDSKKIAYGVGGYQQHYKLKIQDVETGTVTDTGADGVGAVWSPDGKWLAYTGNVAKGGSWMGGIPVDGTIMKLDLNTMKSETLTEAPTNVYDKQTKRWELSGAYNPRWSRDGKKIAYYHQHTIRNGSETTLDKTQIWVMNADGSGKKKIFDGRNQFDWSPDSSAIFVKVIDGIKRIDIGNGEQKNMVAWNVPETPKTDDTKPQVLKGNGAEVDYILIKPEYAKAILAIASEARKIYADRFGFDMPDVVTVHINKGHTQLYTDGQSQMFLTVSSNDALLPPDKSGVFNIYGICHELGHVAMYRSIKMLGLPKGLGEGWAHYTGSVVVDEVYKKLGPKVWPQPYDYAKVDGMGRLIEQSKSPDAANDNTKAALVFYAVQQKYGVDKVMSAMKAAIAGKPYGKDLMPRFVDALVKETGDESARKLVPDDLMTTKVDWNVKNRQIDEKTVEGEIQDKDDMGITLRYDDGSSDDMRSTAGAGHAVVYMTPASDWAVDSISIYASRYGEPEPPKENFSVFICDKDLNIIKEIEKPYSTFERGDPKWYKLDFEPVKVPRGFYILVYFNPTATKGIYVYTDKDVKPISHSRSALPWSFVNDVDKNGVFDWMIRAHIVAVK